MSQLFGSVRFSLALIQHHQGCQRGRLIAGLPLSSRNDGICHVGHAEPPLLRLDPHAQLGFETGVEVAVASDGTILAV